MWPNQCLAQKVGGRPGEEGGVVLSGLGSHGR